VSTRSSSMCHPSILARALLVGHSYSGFVARHVGDRMPDRIRSLIYLDAFVSENGKTLFDYLPDNGEGDRKLAVAHGDGGRVPPRPASFFAVNAADAPWVDSQCTMHPLSSFEAPAQISGACDDIAFDNPSAIGWHQRRISSIPVPLATEERTFGIGSSVPLADIALLQTFLASDTLRMSNRGHRVCGRRLGEE
jgi:pimeloyl-ACP methyl ester carboxylesterase